MKEFNTSKWQAKKIKKMPGIKDFESVKQEQRSRK